ncbi:carbohydrate ABC transporter permease [Microbacterium sp. 69-10]|uniref:carbohydrate ABC transporter permease n=1 Tax=Microbacterium sp. 69-10 TaxID=1895783 RepID=UPI0025E948E0|nr:carbohydrate ABC transporter permease [Microbacterium sp. 69-10]
MFSLFTLLPLLSIFLISLYPDTQVVRGLALPESLDFSNYARAWDIANFSVLMKNSVIVAVFVVPIAAFISILGGYAFATMRFRGSGVLFLLFLLGLLLPYEAPIVPLYYDLNSLGLTGSPFTLIVPEIALFLSFGMFWMRAAFGEDSRTLIEAARIDGAGSWTTLWRVLVPSVMPAIVTLLVLFFMWSWNEFLLALVLAGSPDLQTAPAGIGLFLGEHVSDLRGLAAAAVIMSIPALVVYVFLQRSFIQGVTSGGVKG